MPAGANAQGAIPSSAATNDAAAAAGDSNLPRMYFEIPITYIIRNSIGKEERTPSDSQSNTSERPMIEIKKQKTQK